MSDEELKKLLTHLFKQESMSLVHFLEWHNKVCLDRSNDALLVFLDHIRRLNFCSFSEQIESEMIGVIKDDSADEIVDYLLSLKYPILMFRFARYLVNEGRGLEVLSVVKKRQQSLCREYAIYAILLNAFEKDELCNSYELPVYISEVNHSYFVRLFFIGLYRFNQSYDNELYERLLSGIVKLCKLDETYLKENLGCLLVLIENGYDQLTVKKKSEVLRCLDEYLLSSEFIFTEVNREIIRVATARARLLLGLGIADMQNYFKDELAKVEVRFEGWMIPEKNKHYSINRECLILLSWLELLKIFKNSSRFTQFVWREIHARLQRQIKLVGNWRDVYENTLQYFVVSIERESSVFEDIIKQFIVNTDDLVYVLDVLNKIETLKPELHSLLKQRWEQDKDIIYKKVCQKQVYPDVFKKITDRLNLTN